jgi:hypothetical protein
MSGSIERRRIIEKLGEGTVPGHLLFNDFYNRRGDMSAKLARLTEIGTLVVGPKGKLMPAIKFETSTSPWFHVKMPTNRFCMLWHDVYFRHFGFVPRGCRKCWKLVITTHEDPEKQRVSDLFRLRDFLISMNMPSKCGCDVRQYTPSRYDGFIYSDSLTEGRLYYDMVLPKLKAAFPNATLILKRACTEFEHRFPGSDKWDEQDGWNALEDYLDYIIDTHNQYEFSGLMAHADADTFRFWIEYAHGIGDSSWREALELCGYTTPDDLFFKPVTYHEETDNGSS